jgi:hypothetical protein
MLAVLEVVRLIVALLAPERLGKAITAALEVAAGVAAEVVLVPLDWRH